MSGTFYSLVLHQPPFPFHPFPELPAVEVKPGVFIYDDSTVDYLALAAERVALDALEAAFFAEFGDEPAMMSMSGSSEPGLKLTVPAITNGVVFTSVFEADTNSAYDLFERLAFHPAAPWVRIAGTEIGETNFTVSLLSSNAAFYRAADTMDSDFDGLSDAFEELVAHTNPLSEDSDGDGILDGREDGNGNAIPDSVDYTGLTRVVIFAVQPAAVEGGSSGQLRILLPAPAPAGGATISLHLSGNTDQDTEYVLQVAGVPVTDTVTLAAGQQQMTIEVQAVDDLVQ